MNMADNDPEILVGYDVDKIAEIAARVGGDNIITRLMMGDTKNRSKCNIKTWLPTSGSTIVVVVIMVRVSPGTTSYNDGICQAIVCIIGVYLLNFWGKSTGKTYDIYPFIVMEHLVWMLANV